MNSDVELHIRLKFPWQKLPVHVKQLLGNSVEEYEKCIVNFSIRNQLRHKGNLVRSVMKDEKRYYEILLQYSREHLMLFPYHLSDVTVKGLRMTPFQYYIGMMMDLMTQEKSYDSLPNFTAADCLRLLGIGRNQYLDLMNQCRSVKKLFRRKPLRDLLPMQPIADITMEPWWIAQVGYVTEDDVKVVLPSEKVCIDKLIDNKCCKAGELPFADIYGLYRKGLIYLDVPIEDEDFIIVPPLEGFVMNRVMGDYFETLLYKIFVSIDENTTIAELANILQIDLQLVKNAVSMYCRLGIAYPKGKDADSNDWHPSWAQYKARSPRKPPQDGVFLLDFNTQHFSETKIKSRSSESSSQEEQDSTASTSTGHCKRIALLFDSTLTAFLMMGNLSSGLKSHAVTMFEVGKLPDESLDSLLSELEKVADVGEGEAQRYFDHALTLRSTILFLRHNRDLFADINPSSPLGLDLIRCESLQNLEADACSRLLNKNYLLLVSMAPLSHEIRPISIGNPHHLGPAIPEVNTLWFKLFVYQLTGSGPPSLLLAKGTRLRCMPKVLLSYDHLLVTTWGHDPGVVPSWNALISLNDALTHSAVLVQAYRKGKGREILHVPFPLNEEHSGGRLPQWVNNHAALQALANKLDLRHCCGYVTLLNLSNPNQVQTQETKENITTSATQSPKNGFRDQMAAEVLAAELDTLAVDANEETLSPELDELEISNHDEVGQAELGDASDFVLLECCFGLPLFDPKLNADICDRISSRKLCSKERLDGLTASSCTMANELLDFITGIQDTTMVNNTADFTSKLMGSGCVTTPQLNMIFYEGKLEPWNGR